MKPNVNRKISKQRINQLKELLKRINIYKTLNINEKNIGSKNFSAFDEALTHTSAQTSINHERLEFLGDAVLRLAASEFIEKNFPQMNVGQRSSLRAQLVSDKWLADLGELIKIEDALLISSKAKEDLAAKKTIHAEATEALIGAIYEFSESLDPIDLWLAPHWQKTSKDFLNNPQNYNSKSALQEWSQSHNLNLPQYKTEEINKQHGDKNRFFCEVWLNEKLAGHGWGGSRKEAEQNAALNKLHNLSNENLL